MQLPQRSGSAHDLVHAQIGARGLARASSGMDRISAPMRPPSRGSYQQPVSRHMERQFEGDFSRHGLEPGRFVPVMGGAQRHGTALGVPPGVSALPHLPQAAAVKRPRQPSQGAHRLLVLCMCCMHDMFQRGCNNRCTGTEFKLSADCAFICLSAQMHSCMHDCTAVSCAGASAYEGAKHKRQASSSLGAHNLMASTSAVPGASAAAQAPPAAAREAQPAFERSFCGIGPVQLDSLSAAENGFVQCAQALHMAAAAWPALAQVHVRKKSDGNESQSTSMQGELYALPLQLSVREALATAGCLCDKVTVAKRGCVQCHADVKSVKVADVIAVAGHHCTLEFVELAEGEGPGTPDDAEPALQALQQFSERNW